MPKRSNALSTNQARILDYSTVRSGARSAAGNSSRGSRPQVSRGSSSRRASSAKMEQASRQPRGRKGQAQDYGNGYSRAQARSGKRAYVGSQASGRSRASRRGGIGHVIGGVFAAIAEAIASFFSRGHSVRFYLLTGLLACVVLSGAFLYPGVKDYYTAVRDQAKSQAEYAALQDYYSELQDDVAYLSSDEGVEDAVRAKYGWVYPVENAVLVQGVQSESDFDGTSIGIVPSGSIEAPETWYSGILDPFFGYKG